MMIRPGPWSAGRSGGPPLVLLVIALWAWASPARAAEETLPLSVIFSNQPASNLADVQKLARAWAKDGMDLPYRSGQVETKVFVGCFIPYSKATKLAIFSDDGCDVEVEGKSIHERFKKPQHLPYVTGDDAPPADQEKISLYELKGPSGTGDAWVPGKTYRITVRYSNIIFNGAADIDGCALIAYNDGGGAALGIDPVSRMSLGVNDQGVNTKPINTVRNPAAIVILKKPATAEEEKDGLALIAENTARIEASRDFNSAYVNGNPGSNLAGKIRWSIVGVDTPTGDTLNDATGGQAAFFVENKVGPPTLGQTTIDGNIEVKVYGIKEGRIRITASLLTMGNPPKPDPACMDTYEALVVQQKNVPFRVNLLTSKKAETIVLKGRTPAEAAKLAAQHIRVANVYLRQIGVRLKPDTDVTIDPNKRKLADKVELAEKDLPGFFVARLPDTKLIEGLSKLDMSIYDAIRVNDRDRVVQINYVVSGETAGEHSSDSNQFQGYAVSFPGTPARLAGNDPGVRLKYRISLNDFPDLHDLVLSLGEMQRKEPNTWGTVITDLNDNPRDRSILTFANTIAHEIGHVLALRHRAANADGLVRPEGRNLMFSAGTLPLLDDLDLIEAYGSRTSPVLQP